MPFHFDEKAGRWVRHDKSASYGATDDASESASLLPSTPRRQSRLAWLKRGGLAVVSSCAVVALVVGVKRGGMMAAGGLMGGGGVSSGIRDSIAPGGGEGGGGEGSDTVVPPFPTYSPSLAPSYAPTSSPTLDMDVDDCSALTSGSEDPATCDMVDDAFCSWALDESGGEFPSGVSVSGCKCDSSFGECLLSALSRIEWVCDEYMIRTTPDNVNQPSEDSAFTPDESSRRLTSFLSTFTVNNQIECDASNYCQSCSDSDTCSKLLRSAYAGNVTGVPAMGYDSESSFAYRWHSGQAFYLLSNIDSTCSFVNEATAEYWV